MGLGARRGLLAVVAVSMGWSGQAAAQDRAMLDQLADRQALATASALQAQHKYRPLCDNVPPGFARCYLRARVEDDGTTIHTDAAPVGLGATDIAAAYNLPKTGGNGKVVALIDWADDASAESDLVSYRAQYGLPACTTANGCFKKVDQNGGTSYPAAVSCAGSQTASAGEASLDIEMASAACPDCHIVLIEAVDSSPQNLAAALQTAVTLGAAAISNSYGGPEQGGDAQMEPYYTHAGIIIAAATGDQGYGAGYPATSAGVIAVGGTNLVKSGSSRGWAETVWNDQSGGGGSGCSTGIAKPAWQKDPSCAMRMEADVSAAAEGTDGIAEVCGGQWLTVVGTSAATPIVAAALLVTGQGAGFTPAWVYSHTADFYDITSGSNGTCTTPYFCNAAVGFDGPTGWGTPNGALISGSGSSSGSSSGGSSGSGSGSSSGSSSGGSSGSSGSGSSGGGSSGGSGGSGSTSSGSSSGNGLISDGGANANSDNVGWSPETPAAGCGCTVVGGGEGFGALAVAAGVMLGTGLRRRRRAR
jgi:subtilase family serine protease